MVQAIARARKWRELSWLSQVDLTSVIYGDHRFRGSKDTVIILHVEAHAVVIGDQSSFALKFEGDIDENEVWSLGSDIKKVLTPRL